MLVTSSVSSSSSRTATIRASVSASLALAWSQSDRVHASPFERAWSVRDHPGRVGQGREQRAHDPQARSDLAAAGDLLAHRVLEPGRPEASGAVQVPAVAVHHHGHRRDPGGGAERVLGRLEGGGPHALEQVADLLEPRTCSSMSCSRRAPRCRSRPQVSSTGSGR